MRLFALDIPDAHVGYRNLRRAEFPQELVINDGLEELWRRYEPYADTDFCSEFARQPDARFWEMYLAIRFLDARKKMRRREELTREQRNTGPDICIRKGRRRRIWIEGIATGTGNADNLDQVPDLFAANADEVQNAPRRQIELRITAALRRKAKKFERYCHGGKPARSATRTRCVHSQDVLGPGFDTSLGGHLETSAPTHSAAPRPPPGGGTAIHQAFAF